MKRCLEETSNSANESGEHCACVLLCARRESDWSEIDCAQPISPVEKAPGAMLRSGPPASKPFLSLETFCSTDDYGGRIDGFCFLSLRKQSP